MIKEYLEQEIEYALKKGFHILITKNQEGKTVLKVYRDKDLTREVYKVVFSE